MRKTNKAANGDGSIRERKKTNGTSEWIVELSLGYKANGKRRRTRRVVNTYDAAKKLKKQLLAKQLEGNLTVVRNETVRTFGLHWAREIKPLTIRASTAADYEDRLRRCVFPFLGNVRIIDLTGEHCQKWIRDLVDEGYSDATINGARTTLGMLCKYAMRMNLIPHNPVLATDPVHRKENRNTQVRKPWSVEEVQKVLFDSNGLQLQCFLHVMLYTGLRPGEALGLRWEDLDLDQGFLNVTGTLKDERLISATGYGVVRKVRHDPKTERSRRTLNIHPKLKEVLLKQQDRQICLAIELGPLWKDSGYVITTSVGTEMSLSNLRKRYAKYLTSIGVRYIRFHDLRHTVAVLALEHQVPIAQVSQSLGHERIDTTNRIYAPHVNYFTENFINVLGEVVSPPVLRESDSNLPWSSYRETP